MTFNEKLEKTKQNRSNELNSKINIKKTELEALDENDFNLNYLFDDGTDIGINDLFYKYYKELEIENNTTFNKPTLSNYTKSNWKTIFNDALTYSLSPALYINDSSHNYGQDLILNTVWFNNNGLSSGTTGLLTYINNIINNIGIDATEIVSYTSGYDYATENDAIDARDLYALRIQRAGTALRGMRSKDISPVDAQEDPGAGTNWNFSIGDGTSDNTTYYSDPEKINLITSINNLITKLDNSSIYQQQLNDIYSELDKIFDINNVNHNAKLYNSEITIPNIGDDRIAITSLKANLDTYIGVNTDTVASDTLYGYYNFFNTDDGTNSNFNTYLDNLTTLCNNIKTLINARSNSIPNILGIDENDKLKKFRFFWSKTIIGKPNGSLSIAKSVEDGSDVKNNILKKINSANDELNVLLANKLNEWMPTIKLYATYYAPIIDVKTKLITTDLVGLVYSGQFHSEGYKIFRREASSILFNNDNWADAPLITYTENGENGYVKTSFNDLTVDKNKIYVYRVSAYDTINDSNNTESLQSKIYDDENNFTLNSNIVDDNINDLDCSKINIGKSEFRSNSYCVIIDGNIDNFYVIIEKDDNNIWIYPRINNNIIGNIYYTSSVTSTNL